MSMDVLRLLVDAIISLDLDRCKQLADEALKAGIAASDIIAKGLTVGLEEVGRRYEADQYFLSDLIMAGLAANVIMDVIKPSLGESTQKAGVVLMGTVEGDMHDIGKNLVIVLLRALGYDVHDLGTDIPPKDFVKAVEKTKPDVLGMSSLLTVTVPKMGETIELLERTGIRNRVKVILGGRAATRKIAEEYGADASADDAIKGVETVRSWRRT